MKTCIIVPAYNEEKRLNLEAFTEFVDQFPDFELLFVDDGSQDGTWAQIQVMVSRCPAQIRGLQLVPNQGKAEAVRRGLLEAMAQPEPPEIVGYFDADLATPLEELPRLLEILHNHPEVDQVLASRVQLLGRLIERNPWRHYAGRIFATFASLLLTMPVYDTQCGAKLFRVGPVLQEALGEPFIAGWVFDVELLLRLQLLRDREGLTALEDATVEVPLQTWRDVHGSKVQARDFPRALGSLARLAGRYRLGSSHKSGDS